MSPGTVRVPLFSVGETSLDTITCVRTNGNALGVFELHCHSEKDNSNERPLWPFWDLLCCC